MHPHIRLLATPNPYRNAFLSFRVNSKKFIPTNTTVVILYRHRQRQPQRRRKGREGWKKRLGTGAGAAGDEKTAFEFGKIAYEGCKRRCLFMLSLALGVRMLMYKIVFPLSPTPFFPNPRPFVPRYPLFCTLTSFSTFRSVTSPRLRHPPTPPHRR